jgi:hypothetical protein
MDLRLATLKAVSIYLLHNVSTFCSHLSLSWASSIQSMPTHPTSWRSILILFPTTPGCFKWSDERKMNMTYLRKDFNRGNLSDSWFFCHKSHEDSFPLHERSLFLISYLNFLNYYYLFSLALQPSADYDLLVTQGFVITHNDAPRSVGHLWMSDQLVTKTSSWQHNTHTYNRKTSMSPVGF